MQTFRSVLRFAAVLAPLALMACASDDMAMPTGYTYHNEVYKSAPGPEASKPATILETNAQTAGMNQQGSVTGTLSDAERDAAARGYGSGDPEAYRAISDDLIARMVTNFGRPMEPVFVNESSPMTASLKASMSRHNIPVAAKPGDGPFVLDHGIDGATAIIVFFSNHARVTSESGAYAPPAQ